MVELHGEALSLSCKPLNDGALKRNRVFVNVLCSTKNLEDEGSKLLKLFARKFFQIIVTHNR